MYTYQNIYSIFLISFQNDEQIDLQMEINSDPTPSSSIQRAQHTDIVKSSGFVKQVGQTRAFFFHFLRIINQNSKALLFSENIFKEFYHQSKNCFRLSIFITLRCYLIAKCIQNYADYRISSNKRPWRLLNFETVKCGAYQREVLISKLGKWAILNVKTLSFFLSK